MKRLWRVSSSVRTRFKPPRFILPGQPALVDGRVIGVAGPRREWLAGMSQVVIIATTGRPQLRRAVESVLAQTVPTACYVVCDGEQFRARVEEVLNGLDVPVCVLPRNVGADGFYGHRIYAAFAHLVDEDHVLFLDDDNFFAPDHVAQCVGLITARGLQWCYSLRNICTPEGEFICRDDCDSLGKFSRWQLIDTNQYCIRRDVLLQSAHLWHGKLNQDMVFAQVMIQNFTAFDCTGLYSVQYCLGSERGTKSEFFERGNALMLQHYPRGFPWTKSAEKESDQVSGDLVAIAYFCATGLVFSFAAILDDAHNFTAWFGIVTETRDLVPLLLALERMNPMLRWLPFTMPLILALFAVFIKFRLRNLRGPVLRLLRLLRSPRRAHLVS